MLLQYQNVFILWPKYQRMSNTCKVYKHLQGLLKSQYQVVFVATFCILMAKSKLSLVQEDIYVK